ncbi:MAG TPA: GNAT family N-acetyltransferase [Pyrinomonadaceae bacterium]
MTVKQNWQAQYREKLKDAARAVRAVRRGQKVFIGSGAAEPQALVRALSDRAEELADTEIYHIMTLGIAPYAESKFARHFRHNAFFIGTNVRAAIEEGRADYTPVFLSEVPKLFRTRRIPLDVALISVSPPDEHGYCSYGVSVDVVKAAAESATLVIAEVNRQMPRTLGDSFIHVSRIDCLVESDAPLPVLAQGRPDDVAMEIGRHVASLIDDGSTIQMGIGVIPNAVLAQLGGKRRLGVHTEMFSDGVIDLIESGVIDCSKKTLLAGKVVSSFCMGTPRLYEYVDNNPLFEFRSVEFVNDPFQIARNEKMVAINAAIEVDLTGQVAADSIGSRFYSGIGGQVDFIRGAARSEGGKPVIALRSTAKGDTLSRIVPRLQGAGVVTTRGDVHYIVTEYGVADLWGRNVRERAMALINIAHPRFRQELLAEAKRARLVYDDQILLHTASYPKQWERIEPSKDGTSVYLRAVKPTDEAMMKELFYTCSEQSLYDRYFQVVKAMPHEKLQRIVNVDYENEMSVVARMREGGHERIVGAASYTLNPATNTADVAFLVHDEYQARGLGTLLLQHLMRIARSKGVAGFTADVLAHNHAMLKVFHNSGCEMKSSLADNVYQLEFYFDRAQKGSGAGERDAAEAADSSAASL